MAKAHEKTFENLQRDERYKKLERTLKMALLKNGDRRNDDNANTGTWPNISSINGDNLDMSLAAMSVQSLRFGSEVVSSSTNLRNILSHKQQFSGSGPNAATSSENQFSINKIKADSVMMPPPRIPGVPFSRTKRLSDENSRAPLSNMPQALARNNNAFVMSTPASSLLSIPKFMGTKSIEAKPVFQETNNYDKNTYGESAQKQERSFSRWRVLLNDKGGLIIKGTLECGKIARSKPVIRRLTSRSVQSIFSHTYHLLGNIVDDRNELPDYVRGKFYNGFPYDWENVYQVWRAFVSDGNRLSFRWPTPVTDSDDDIKSGITEIAPRRTRYKQSVSPRKRNRSAKTSSNLDVSDSPPLEESVHDNTPPPENVQQINSKKYPLAEPRETGAMYVDRERLNESSVVSFNTTTRHSVNSLGSLIPENKLNMIIDNLTQKSYPIEYVDNIIKMLESMKYVASYQSSIENEMEKDSSLYPEKMDSRTLAKTSSRSADKKSDPANTLSSKNHPLVNKPNPSSSSEYINQPSSNVGNLQNDKSHKNPDRQTRRKLTNYDYRETSESDNNSDDETRKTSPPRYPASNKRLRKTTKYDNSTDLVASRISKEYVEPEQLSDARQHGEPRAIRTKRHNVDVVDSKFVADRSREDKSRNNRMSPRKTRGIGKENQRETVYYDSCVSYTEDDEHYTEKAETMNTRHSDYDSCVSISEDEYVDVASQTRMRNYTDHKASPLQPKIRGIGNSSNDRKIPNDVNYRPETNSRHVEQSLSRIRDPRRKIESSNRDHESIARHPEQSKIDNIYMDRKRQDPMNSRVEVNSHPVEQVVDEYRAVQTPRLPRKSQPFISPPTISNDRDFHVAPNPTRNINVKTTHNSKVNNPSNQQKIESAHLSYDAKRSKQLIVNRETTEIKSSKSYNNKSNSQEFQQKSETDKITPPKSKTPPTIRKKPSVVSVVTVQMNIAPRELNKVKEIEKRAGSSPQNDVDQPSNVLKKDQKNRTDILAPTNPVETTKQSKTRNKDGNNLIKLQDGKSSNRENKVEFAEKPAVIKKDATDGEYGSEQNPKLLTAWVPAIIFDEDEDKYHLIFEGNLLNEARHIAVRKFTTDSIRRRLSPKIVETTNHEFYELVGDLNDTKHVVPKELIKACQTGCPGKIGNFCQRWASMEGAIYTNPPQNSFVNTLVDCLDVPTSSRGRRILPPLHYWAGERVATKDNKTMYSAGTSQELSIPSSLENSTTVVTNKKNSPKKRSESKKSNESKSTDTKKKDADKILSPSFKKPNPSPSKISRESQKTRVGKRRLAKNVQFSSSEDDDDTHTKSMPRKRKARVNENEIGNAENSSTRRFRNSSKNPEHASISPKKSSFEKLSDPDVKFRLKKRQKTDDNPGTSQQYNTRQSSEIKCVRYTNVPMHNDDLSEDQLSTM